MPTDAAEVLHRLWRRRERQRGSVRLTTRLGCADNVILLGTELTTYFMNVVVAAHLRKTLEEVRGLHHDYCAQPGRRVLQGAARVLEFRHHAAR